MRRRVGLGGVTAGSNQGNAELGDVSDWRWPDSTRRMFVFPPAQAVFLKTRTSGCFHVSISNSSRILPRRGEGEPRSGTHWRFNKQRKKEKALFPPHRPLEPAAATPAGGKTTHLVPLVQKVFTERTDESSCLVMDAQRLQKAIAHLELLPHLVTLQPRNLLDFIGSLRLLRRKWESNCV